MCNVHEPSASRAGMEKKQTIHSWALAKTCLCEPLVSEAVCPAAECAIAGNMICGCSHSLVRFAKLSRMRLDASILRSCECWQPEAFS